MYLKQLEVARSKIDFVWSMVCLRSILCFSLFFSLGFKFTLQCSKDLRDSPVQITWQSRAGHLLTCWLAIAPPFLFVKVGRGSAPGTMSLRINQTAVYHRTVEHERKGAAFATVRFDTSRHWNVTKGMVNTELWKRRWPISFRVGIRSCLLPGVFLLVYIGFFYFFQLAISSRVTVPQLLYLLTYLDKASVYKSCSLKSVPCRAFLVYTSVSLSVCSSRMWPRSAQRRSTVWSSHLLVHARPSELLPWKSCIRRLREGAQFLRKQFLRYFSFKISPLCSSAIVDYEIYSASLCRHLKSRDFYS